MHVRQHHHTRFLATCNHEEMNFQSLTRIESNLFDRGPSVSRPNPSSGHFHVLTREQKAEASTRPNHNQTVVVTD